LCVSRFPYINRGFPNDPVPGDCSWTYSQANGSIHWVINAVYSIVAFIPFLAGIHYIRLSKRIRLKQKRTKLNRMTLLDKIFVILLLFSGSTTLMCLDTSGEGGFVPMRIYTFLVGFAMVSASIVMKHLVMDWVAIVEMKGSKKITPMWIKWQYWITVCMQTFSDVFLQQYEMHQDPRDAWSFNGE